ncbi:MAG TPA: triose-phosphate isomerase [Patescibacteria group bacterium]|nr:triose-phosphate isomerase [Patescibacteria group bacterium]
MRKQLFVANWKSHKTQSEAQLWLQTFTPLLYQTTHTVILCPPFPLLAFCKSYIAEHHLPITLGSQTVSPHEEGAYTGEVSARTLKDFVEYVIIGHSETRQLHHETDEQLQQKVTLALAHGLTPIYCVSTETQPIPKLVTIVAYEPLFAIGSGHPANPNAVEEIAHSIKQRYAVSYILYGGSVTGEDVMQFSRLLSIGGVLVGGASLSPQSFAKIIHHA